MNFPNTHVRSHSKTARRFYYAVGVILFLLGVVLMLLRHAIHQEGEFWKILEEVGTFLALIVALHFLYEVFVKKQEHQLFIGEMETIVRGELKQVTKTLNLSAATFYPSQEDAHSAVIKAIDERAENKKYEKTILLAALHGHSGKRRTLRPESDLSHKAFADTLYKCIESSGKGMWYVRELYNITDEERLEMILKRMQHVGDTEGYEVRAFCLQNVLPQLTPLVVDNEDLFIGWDDPTYYGVRGAMHVRGLEFGQTATEYFNSLWNDKRVFILRSALGIDDNQVNSLRRALKRITRTKN